MDAVTVWSHPDCERHQPGLGHPETPVRVKRTIAALADLDPQLVSLRPEVELPPEDELLGVLSWVHDRDYIERVRVACRAGRGSFDSPDCVVSPGSWEALEAATGLALKAALDLASGRCRRAFVAARPPAHHAERDRARGYCFFNHTAVAAEVLARAAGGAILVVDVDAHHGNGTQRHFWERADVGFLSVHEYPAFPGSGGADETGAGRGAGTTRNLPLAAGADDDAVVHALEAALDDLGARVRPAAVVVSAGFSGHASDPVSGWRMTDAGFSRLTKTIVQCAETWSDGRVLSILEGGYDVDALEACVRAHVEALARGSEVN
jgi:acetoin utilization deacetylase AcuC-like enzyme